MWPVRKSASLFYVLLLYIYTFCVGDIFQANRITFTPLEPESDPRGIAIFIHSAMGLPHPTNNSHYGSDVLIEMIQTIKKVGLMARKRTRIFVSMLGKQDIIDRTVLLLQQHNKSHNNIHIIIRSNNVFATELPTIHAVHIHAQRSHPR